MARIKFKVNQRRLTSELIRSIDKIISSEPLKEEIGQFSTERIAFQARKGKPINNKGSFPKLKKATKKNRRYLERFNQTHPAYRAGRSNVTLTGRLIDSLSFKSVRDGIQLLWKGNHKPYRGKSGTIGKSVPNEKIIEGLADNKYFVFTASALRKDQKFNGQIVRIVRKFLRRQLKRTRRRS